MFINQKTAISTSSVLLIPYSTSHVPTYHEWMQDPEIQTLTASEPLSLEEEYSMQKSWRSDGDKLTFIACLPLKLPLNGEDTERKSIEAGEERMVGDVNLFLSPPENLEDGDENENENEKGIFTGELELMIAESKCRRKGYGRGAIVSFMMFIERNLEGILGEYVVGGEKARGLRLRVKIGGENEKSIGLFEGLGFERVGEGVNYFGECELRFGRVLRVGEVGGMEELGRRFGVVGYRELEYVDVDGGESEV